MAQFPNYLRSNRKRLAFSQEEVAFLLGMQTGNQVCRYERFAREPGLETALALEAILQRPASELFGGLYQKVQGEAAVRAKVLIVKADREKPNRRTALRRRYLPTLRINLSPDHEAEPAKTFLHLSHRAFK